MENFDSLVPSASGKLRRRLKALATALLLAPAAWAQVVVPAGNPNGTGGAFLARKPLGTYFGYERSAVIYSAAEIGASGSITNLGYYVVGVNSPGAVAAKIYLKTVSNSAFDAATTVAAEEAGATLVYDGTIPAASFTANTWVSVPLTAPFAYNGTSNLEVIIETNTGGSGNEVQAGKGFRYTNTGGNTAQYWQQDATAPTIAGTLTPFRPNIQLTGLTAPTCAPVTGLAATSSSTTSAQVTFTGGTGNTSYTVTYAPAGGSATTVTPAPTASPVTLNGLTPGTSYTVVVAGNCGGGASSQATITGFSTRPINDDCANAVTLTPGATCVPVSGTVAGASQSNAPILCTGLTAATAQDVWYKFTATATALNVNVAGNFNGVVEVFSGASCTALSSVACSDATGNNEALTLNFLTVGSTYYVRYYPFASNPADGTFTICVAPPLIPNDDPISATPLTVNATCVPTNSTNTGATTTTPNGYMLPGASPFACGITDVPRDVWFKFTTAASGAGSTAVAIQVTGTPASVIRLFSAPLAAGPFTLVRCTSGSSSAAAPELAINTLSPSTTYYVAVSGYSAISSPQGAFTICVIPSAQLPANDAALSVLYATGRAPVSAPQVVQAVVRNTGSLAITNVPVTLTVAGATTFADAKIIPTLAPGASAVVTFASYTPAAVGTNTLTVTLQPDDVNTNNVQTYSQVVTANSLSYVDYSQALTLSVGVSSTVPGGAVVTKYSINSTSVIGQVNLTFTASATTTSTYQVQIFDATGANGTPGAVLFTSPTQSRPAAAGTVSVPVTGNITVNGPFYVGLREVSGNVGIAYQSEDPLRPGTFYYQTSATGAWTDLNTTTLKTRLAIEAVFSSRVLSTNSAALSKAITLFPNPSTGQVTLDIQGAQAKGAMQVEVTNMLGQVVHTAAVRDNAQNKLDLSGLATGLYIVRVKSGAEYSIRQLALTK